MCLASIVAGLSGLVGRQVGYAQSRLLQEALKLAFMLDEIEKHQKLNENLYKRSDECSGQLPRSSSK